MKPRIFIDAGAWYLAYYMGMWEYILEHFGREAFKGVYFDGISAGGQVATHIIASIYSDKLMKTWLETGPKTVVKNDKYGNNCRITEGIYNTGYTFYTNLNKTQRRAIRKYVRVFCTDSLMNGHCCDKISNACEYASAITATSNIPLILSYKPIRFREKYLWDGVLGSSCYSLIHKKTLCISFSKRVHFYNMLDLSNWVYHKDYISLLPSFLPQQMTLVWCDLLFERGYNDAKANRKELLEKFQSIGIHLS
jgi:hypothetical protein